MEYKDKKSQRKLWGAIQVVKGLFPDNKKWNNEVLQNLKNIFNEYKNDVDLSHIAFPNDWYELLRK